jgi:hypothetical protein
MSGAEKAGQPLLEAGASGLAAAHPIRGAWYACALMNIEICPICDNPMQGNWREIGAWDAKTPISRVFDGWKCASGCDEGPRRKEWLKQMKGRQGIA